MSRRHRAEKRATTPDIRYTSPLGAHLINVIMKQGKKSLAQRIVYGAFERVSEKLGKGDPVDLLIGALENARPRLEVKSRRVGGATYDEVTSSATAIHAYIVRPRTRRWSVPATLQFDVPCGGSSEITSSSSSVMATGMSLAM